MQSALQNEEPSSEDVAVQLQRIADALERLAAVRRVRTVGDSKSPQIGNAGVGRTRVSSRWTFHNQGIRAALRRAAVRQTTARRSA